jgi:hypothetical protein
MLTTLTHAELVENIAWFDEYPFTPTREDYRAATIAYWVALDHIRNPNSSKITDYLIVQPELDKPKPEKQSWQTQLALMKQFTSALSTEIKKE